MKILVTGATGFIGGRFLELAPADAEIVAVARPGARTEDAQRDRVSWVEADLARPGFETALPGEVDAVVHLAQSRRDRDFPEGAEDVLGVNVAATGRLLDHARRSGARRFLLASTATVYERSSEPLTEESPLDCSSLYAASKRSAELLGQAFGDDLSCLALRIFTVYGAGQRGRLVSDLVERVGAGEPVQVQGERGLLLSPIHVDDVAATLRAAVEAGADSPGFEIANVPGPQALGIREIAEEIGKALGTEPELELTGGEEPGGLVAGRSKLEGLLEVPEPIGFAEGIRRTVSPASEPAR
jgi:UDP-glucose 4-epimerase